MEEPHANITCPTCNAGPGEPCVEGSREVRVHSNRVRADQVEFTTKISKAAAFWIARTIHAANDEPDPDLNFELEGIEIELAQLSAELWDSSARFKQ